MQEAKTRTKKPAIAAPERGSESLSGRAYDRIREDILRGDLSMGDILSRRKLAAKLNMSFLPITEALQRLETEGLVESKPRVGTRVRIPTREHILDSYVLREALETQAARLCAEKMTPAERKILMRNAKHLDKLYKVSESEQGDSRFLFSVHTYHMQFHISVAEYGRSPGLLKAIEKGQVLVFNWIYDTAAHRTSLPTNFHADLADALCNGTVQQADTAMRAHVRFGMDGVIETLSSIEHSQGWRLKKSV